MANQVPNSFYDPAMFDQDYIISSMFTSIGERNEIYPGDFSTDDILAPYPSTFNSNGYYLPLTNSFIPANSFPQHQNQQQLLNFSILDNEGFSSSQSSSVTSYNGTPRTTPYSSPDISYHPSPLISNNEGATDIKKSRRTKKKNTGKFSCSECKKTYTRIQDVKRHFKNHTNERLEICEFCPKSFNRNDTLARHEKTCSKNPNRIHVQKKKGSCKY